MGALNCSISFLERREREREGKRGRIWVLCLRRSCAEVLGLSIVYSILYSWLQYDIWVVTKKLPLLLWLVVADVSIQVAGFSIVYCRFAWISRDMDVWILLSTPMVVKVWGREDGLQSRRIKVKENSHKNPNGTSMQL